jgi:electron transport complex protein RnfA
MDNLPWIFISALLVNNFVLTYFLGLCPFLGVSNSLETSARLGAATTFVMLVTAVCAWILNTYVLIHAPYLRLICFIVVIASTVQFIEMLIKKLSPALFRAMGIFLPLITTNCAILGLAIFATNRGYGFWEGIVYALGAGIGFTLALVLLAGLREESELSNIPKLIQGTAMNLIIAGILSMASSPDCSVPPDDLFHSIALGNRTMRVLGSFPALAGEARSRCEDKVGKVRWLRSPG